MEKIVDREVLAGCAVGLRWKRARRASVSVETEENDGHNASMTAATALLRIELAS